MNIYHILQLADDALILGHRLGEWCGHGPILEQDIALTNMSLDHLGRARSLYQYAAELLNNLPVEEKAGLFASMQLKNHILSGEAIDEDHLAYQRDEWDFRNVLLVEQPNTDWAYTVARALFTDVFNFYYYTELQKSDNTTLAAIAEKSLKEITYHLRWSSEWTIRLGDGTGESHERMQTAISDLWVYSGELMKATGDETINPEIIKPQWQKHIAEILQKATLQQPADTWMQTGGKDGRHTEHLGYILAEMQYMQRAYPGMKW